MLHHPSLTRVLARRKGELALSRCTAVIPCGPSSISRSPNNSPAWVPKAPSPALPVQFPTGTLPHRLQVVCLYRKRHLWKRGGTNPWSSPHPQLQPPLQQSLLSLKCISLSKEHGLFVTMANMRCCCFPSTLTDLFLAFTTVTWASVRWSSVLQVRRVRFWLGLQIQCASHYIVSLRNI